MECLRDTGGRLQVAERTIRLVVIIFAAADGRFRLDRVMPWRGEGTGLHNAARRSRASAESKATHLLAPIRTANACARMCFCLLMRPGAAVLPGGVPGGRRVGRD